ncbi:MAG: FHA domain-containing protein [Chloroflexi bacterium]|nr:FHA domain-containing protein [Chloroflexota bacterium]
MSHGNETPRHLPNHLVECPRCGTHFRPDNDVCPTCGHSHTDIDETKEQIITELLERTPLTTPRGAQRRTLLDPGAQVFLQFLPSADCIALSDDPITVLGRGEDVFNLNSYNALQHGVSRKHCRLERHPHRLILTDLGSTNGTYLNDERLIPFHPYPVADGDKLILGTLHIFVTVSS